MKTKNSLLVLALAGSFCALIVTAHDESPSFPPPDHHFGHHRPPPPPVIVVMDANHDGILDAQEIANASVTLMQLDKNNDGQLTREELRPPRPEGGPGGPDGDCPRHGPPPGFDN